LFFHILPPKYNEAFVNKARKGFNYEANALRPELANLDVRFKTFDKFEGLKQVLTLGAPGVESAFPQDAVEMARIANDGMAELVSKYPEQYFKRIYGDTVLGGNTSAMMCGYSFFGADHMVFSTDYPYTGADLGLAAVIKGIEGMNITNEEKAKIFSKNVRQLLKLS